MDLRLQAEVLAYERQAVASTAKTCFWWGSHSSPHFTLATSSQPHFNYGSHIFLPPNPNLTFLSGQMLTQPSVRFRFRIRAWVVREKAKTSSWSGAWKGFPKDISLCSQCLPLAFPFQLWSTWSSRLSIALNCNSTSNLNSNPRAKDKEFRSAVLGQRV